MGEGRSGIVQTRSTHLAKRTARVSSVAWTQTGRAHCWCSPLPPPWVICQDSGNSTQGGGGGVRRIRFLLARRRWPVGSGVAKGDADPGKPWVPCACPACLPGLIGPVRQPAPLDVYPGGPRPIRVVHPPGLAGVRWLNLGSAASPVLVGDGSNRRSSWTSDGDRGARTLGRVGGPAARVPRNAARRRGRTAPVDIRWPRPETERDMHGACSETPWSTCAHRSRSGQGRARVRGRPNGSSGSSTGEARGLRPSGRLVLTPVSGGHAGQGSMSSDQALITSVQRAEAER